MSQSKREQVVSHLRYIRQELREMHQGVMAVSYTHLTLPTICSV